IINRPDTIIVASVSAIYSLGNPADYRNLTFQLKQGQTINRKDLINQLIAIQYKRNDLERESGTFHVVGNVITLTVPYHRDRVRLELFGDKLDLIEMIDRTNNTAVKALED